MAQNEGKETKLNDRNKDEEKVEEVNNYINALKLKKNKKHVEISQRIA